MKDIEKRIQDAQLKEPPERLDRSIEKMIRWAETEHPQRSGYRKPLWFAVAGCAAGLLIGVLLGPLVHGGGESAINPTTTVVIVEPTPELERWVTAGNARPRGSFFERSHSELETVYVAGDSLKNIPNSL